MFPLASSGATPDVVLSTSPKIFGAEEQGGCTDFEGDYVDAESIPFVAAAHE